MDGADETVAFDNFKVTGDGGGGGDDPDIAAPTSKDFGSIDKDSVATQTVLVQNNGSANALNISDLTVSGADQANFSVTSGTAPVAVDPGRGLTLVVEFDPAGSAGTYSAQLDITSDDPSDALTTVALTGEAFTPATPVNLFFSEYIEGSGNNKGVEIFNNSGSTQDLTALDVEIWVYSNGGTSPSSIIDVSSAALADQDVWAVVHPSAGATLLGLADETGNCYWNGNDAVALVQEANSASPIFLDVIGRIGEDAYWGTSPTSTVENTLVRKNSITIGDRDETDAFDPADEWNGYAQDTFTYFGSHSIGGATPEVTVNPASLALTAAIDATATDTLEVGNASISSTLNVSAMTFTGADAAYFSITPTSAAIAPSSSTLAVVEFAPDTVRSYSATLEIASDDPDSPTTLSVTGTGVLPIVFDKDFEDGSLVSGGWTTYDEEADGLQVWEIAGYGADGSAQSAEMNGYDSGSQNNNDWLISPQVDLDAVTSPSLSFWNQYQYGSQDADNFLKLYYSSDFSGDPTAASWTELSFGFDGSGNTWFYNEIDLSAIGGQVHFAFEYQSRTNARRWTLDEIALRGAPLPPAVFLTEVADPGDVYQARFVEIYNGSASAVDLTGWELRRYAGTNTTPGVVSLDGLTIQPNGFILVANSDSAFQTAYGFLPDTSNGSVITGNGDDTYELFDGSAVIDIYGEVGTDGTGEAWEYEDSRAERVATVTRGNTVWTASEWTITSANTSDMDPGEWIGAIPDDPDLVAPAGQAFAAFIGNTDTQDILLHNAGTTNTLEISTLTLTGANAANFAITSPTVLPSPGAPLALAPGANARLQIAFDPLGEVATTFTATLEIESNDEGDALVSVDLTGVSSAGAVPTEIYALDNEIQLTFDLDPGVIDPADVTFTEAGTGNVTVTAVNGNSGGTTRSLTVALDTANASLTTDSLTFSSAGNAADATYGFYGYRSIATVRSLPLGTQATIAGSVTGMPNGTGSINYALADASGPNNGIIVRDYASHDQIAIGDRVEAVGATGTYNNLTQFGNPLEAYSITPGAGVAITPTVVPVSDFLSSIAADSAPAEQYEGVLITVQGLENATDAGFGEVEFDNGIQLGDEWFDIQSVINLGGDYDVTGVGYYSFSEYKIQPRSAADLIEVTPDDPDIALVGSGTFGAIFSDTSKTLELVIENNGVSLALDLTTITITGDTGGVFDLGAPLPTSVGILSSDTLTLIFDPQLTTGTFSAELRIESNDPGDAVTTLALNGVSAARSSGGIDFISPAFGVAVDYDDIVSLVQTETGEDWAASVGAGDAFTINLEIDLATAGNLIVDYDPASGTGMTQSTMSYEPMTSNGTYLFNDSLLLAASPNGDTDADITGLTVDSAGDLYFLDTQNDEVFVYDYSADTVTKLGDAGLNSTLSFGTNLAYDGTALYYGNYQDTDSILSLPAAGGSESTFLTTAEIETGTGGSAWSASTGPVSAPGGSEWIYWWDEGRFGGIESLVRVNTGTKAFEVVADQAAIEAAGGSAPEFDAMAVAPDGTVAALNSDFNDEDPALYLIEADGTVHRYPYSQIESATGQTFDHGFGAIALTSSEEEIVVYFYNAETDDVLYLRLTVGENELPFTGVGEWTLYE